MSDNALHSDGSEHDDDHPISRYIEVRDLLTFIPGAVAVLAGLKVIVASGGDTGTFRALVLTADIPAILLVTTLTMLPILILAVVIDLREMRIFTSLPTPKYLQVVFWSFCLFALSVPVAYVILATPVVLLRMGIEQISVRARAAGRPLRGFSLSFIALMIVASFVVGPMWLPAEQIELSGPARIEIGYVLSEKEESVTILDSGEGGVNVYKSSSVGQRRVCAIEPVSLFFSNDSWMLRRNLSFYAAKLLGMPRPESPTCSKSKSAG